ALLFQLQKHQAMLLSQSGERRQPVTALFCDTGTFGKSDSTRRGACGAWSPRAHRFAFRPMALDVPATLAHDALQLRLARDAAHSLRLYHYLLDAVATHQVAGRPDRYEPRLKKQRRNFYDWLTKPRAEMKRMMAKGVTEN